MVLVTLDAKGINPKTLVLFLTTTFWFEQGSQGVGYDPNYIKMFKLAQLIIEYLLVRHCAA